MPLPAHDLLAGYAPGSSAFFASPQHTLLAEGVAAQLPPGTTAGSGLGDAARALLAGSARARGTGVVVGAVPFAADRPAALFVPDTARWGGALPRRTPPAYVATTVEAGIRPLPEPEEYAAGVRGA